MRGRQSLYTIDLYIIPVLIHTCISIYLYTWRTRPVCGRPECIYLSIWTRATTEASADSSASSIYPYIYIRGEQGMATDSASSTETSGLGLLRPTEAETY